MKSERFLFLHITLYDDEWIEFFFFTYKHSSERTNLLQKLKRAA